MNDARAATEHRRRSIYNHSRSKEGRAERAPRPATEMELLNGRHADERGALREQQGQVNRKLQQDNDNAIAQERLHHGRDLDPAAFEKRWSDQRKKHQKQWDALERRQDAEREAAAAREHLD